MPIPRIVKGMRILTEEQIQKLGDNSLRLYRRKVKYRRAVVHSNSFYWCCTPRTNRCSVHGERGLTPDEIADIKMYDYLAAACRREVERRKLKEDK